VNRLILKYGYPITAVILLVFAWVVYRRLASGVDAIIPLAVAAIVVWLFARSPSFTTGRGSPSAGSSGQS
jgi:hypothetical protein